MDLPQGGTCGEPNDSRIKDLSEADSFPGGRWPCRAEDEKSVGNALSETDLKPGQAPAVGLNGEFDPGSG